MLPWEQVRFASAHRKLLCRKCHIAVVSSSGHSMAITNAILVNRLKILFCFLAPVLTHTEVAYSTSDGIGIEVGGQ